MDENADIQYLVEDLLRDPSEAASYLNEALKVGDTPTFLRALRDVIEVSAGGMARVAQIMNVKVPHLELILSERTNSELTGIDIVLDAMGFTFVVQAKRKSSH